MRNKGWNEKQRCEKQREKATFLAEMRFPKVKEVFSFQVPRFCSNRVKIKRGVWKKEWRKEGGKGEGEGGNTLFLAEASTKGHPPNCLRASSSPWAVEITLWSTKSHLFPTRIIDTCARLVHAKGVRKGRKSEERGKGTGKGKGGWVGGSYIITVFNTQDLFPQVWKIVECGLCNDAIHQNKSLNIMLSG